MYVYDIWTTGRRKRAYEESKKMRELNARKAIS
jgi:hypothetical protein